MISNAWIKRTESAGCWSIHSIPTSKIYKSPHPWDFDESSNFFHRGSRSSSGQCAQRSQPEAERQQFNFDKGLSSPISTRGNAEKWMWNTAITLSKEQSRCDRISGRSYSDSPAGGCPPVDSWSASWRMRVGPGTLKWDAQGGFATTSRSAGNSKSSTCNSFDYLRSSSSSWQ